MKVLSRLMAKMPIVKNCAPIRYELELQLDVNIYRIVRFLYISNNLYKCEIKFTTIDKELAIKHYMQEQQILTDCLIQKNYKRN